MRFLIFLFCLPFFIYNSLAQETSAQNFLKSGIVKAKLGDYQAAILDINEAIRIDSSLGEAYYNRGIIYT